jgi:predicted enzyme related to lactoylglutathione lyase
MTVRWLTAFLDFTADSFDDGVSFWTTATDTTLSTSRGDDDEFATLLPRDGDAFLRVQRVGYGPGGIHVDVHVDDTERAVSTAVTAGASVIAVNDVTVMSSPGGFTFCIVQHDGADDDGEHVVPSTVEHDGLKSRMNQVCIDIPVPQFDAECAFWSELTGWPLRPNLSTEFGALLMPEGMPFRILFQRLGNDDPGTTVRAHLDIGAGLEWRHAISSDPHRSVEHVGDGSHWAVFNDPTGAVYCVTQRDP